MSITKDDAAMMASFCFDYEERDVETLISAFAEHKEAHTFREQFLWYRKWFYETNGDRLRATIKRLKLEPLKIRKRMKAAEKWIEKQNEILEAASGATETDGAATLTESETDPAATPTEPETDVATLTESETDVAAAPEANAVTELPPFPRWADDGDAIWSTLFNTIFDEYSRMLISNYFQAKRKLSADG